MKHKTGAQHCMTLHERFECGTHRLGVVRRAYVVTEEVVKNAASGIELAMKDHPGLEHCERISVFQVRRQFLAIVFTNQLKRPRRLGSLDLIACDASNPGQLANRLMLKKILQR